jgi:CheY-like chemotaxis protein
MTGSRAAGDAMVAAALAGMLDLPWPDDLSPRAAAFHLFAAARGPVALVARTVADDDTPAARRLARLDPAPREALLLSALDGFADDEVAAILGLSPDEAGARLAAGEAQMARALSAPVLIVEDDRLLAQDLMQMVLAMGHRVAGLARTRAEAVRAGDGAALILADVQLADGSSGHGAVNDLLARDPRRPVVFLTAFPELLLTGGPMPEPVFVLEKPAAPAALRAALSQAAFASDPRA